MALNIKINGEIKGVSDKGNLKFFYGPLLNLKKSFYTYLTAPNYEEPDLGALTLKAKKSNINPDDSVDILIEESYDGSANLIINDKINPPKLINSRFYLTGEGKYNVGDRKGNVDTNIYTEDNFKIESNLTKAVQQITTVEFHGVFNGGSMPIGNYTFYFKLADSDGNESDFIAESGKVVCYIGGVNQPKYIRGGQVNENSNKLIKFTLKNLDLAYHFITVYYTRTTGKDSEEVTFARKIDTPFKITGANTDITITGYETHEDIGISDINTSYAAFDSAKSLENCQNITFAGNITNNYDVLRMLERYSLFVTPYIEYNDNGIGNLDSTYNESYDTINGYEYYNAKNIHDNLGYWEEEIYRIGIVYILNDYTLSPVFNIRGVKTLKIGENIPLEPIVLETSDPSKLADEDGNISNPSTPNTQNVKGIFKIKSGGGMFSKTNIKPLGIGVKFPLELFGGLNPITQYTRGYFIVRQRRIPTILAQGIGIATTKNGYLPTVQASIQNKNSYIINSFLYNHSGTTLPKPRLGCNLLTLSSSYVKSNAMLCPEASLRTNIYNNYFNSSEYVLEETDYQLERRYFTKVNNSDSHFELKGLEKTKDSSLSKGSANVLLVEPEVELIGNGVERFSSKAGDGITAYKNIDVVYGDYSDPKTKIPNIEAFNKSISKVRGVFNTYLGIDNTAIKQNTYYNIFEKGYDFNRNWVNYFKIRNNDSSPYFPIGDRIAWHEGATGHKSPLFFRGDCYISTFTQRMQWNFIDSEMPTNTQIVDPYTWYKNFKISDKATTTMDVDGKIESLHYYKLLPLFTYKYTDVVKLFEKDKDEIKNNSILNPDDKAFKKYSEYNGLYGYEKINKPDVNAVGLGYWVTFKICSNVNLSLRDVDKSRPMEEAVHHMQRSFYPLQSIERNLKLPESKVLNPGLSKTLGDKYHYNLGSAPYLKFTFPTRIYYSNILQQASFTNGNRVFLSKNYQDYTLEYGSIIKLVEWYGTLIAVMEHGVLMIPVNERAMMKNESGENVYINTENVLPKNPKVLSNTFGSIWPNSIIKTSRFVYGIDTIGKKIWRTNGEEFEIISDLKIQKFLNDNIQLKESDKESTTFLKSVKTHHNVFKNDILFVFTYNDTKWNLCWNELLQKWVTRYTWFPSFSENINNIFYTFANKLYHRKAKNQLYKHGFAGTLEESGKILPTKWYDEQHPFEFEFIVNEVQGVQKIFNNLKIISNKVEPNSFIFEVVGDGFDWNDQKQIILDINKTSKDLEDINEKGFNSPFDIPL